MSAGNHIPPSIKVGDVVTYKQSVMSQGGAEVLRVTATDNGDGTFSAVRRDPLFFRGLECANPERDLWLKGIRRNLTTGEYAS